MSTMYTHPIKKGVRLSPREMGRVKTIVGLVTMRHTAVSFLDLSFEDLTALLPTSADTRRPMLWTEEELFELVLAWIDYHPPSRYPHVPALFHLGLLPLPPVTPQFLPHVLSPPPVYASRQATYFSEPGMRIGTGTPHPHASSASGGSSTDRLQSALKYKKRLGKNGGHPSASSASSASSGFALRQPPHHPYARKGLQFRDLYFSSEAGDLTIIQVNCWERTVERITRVAWPIEKWPRYDMAFTTGFAAMRYDNDIYAFGGTSAAPSTCPILSQHTATPVTPTVLQPSTPNARASPSPSLSPRLPPPPFVLPQPLRFGRSIHQWNGTSQEWHVLPRPITTISRREAGVVTCAGLGKLILGGRDETNTPLVSTEWFAFDRTRVGPDTRSPHVRPSLLFLNARILVLGSALVNTCECYDLQVNKGAPEAFLPLAIRPRLQVSPVMCCRDNVVYLLGGVTTPTLVQRFDVEANTWTLCRDLVSSVSSCAEVGAFIINDQELLLFTHTCLLETYVLPQDLLSENTKTSMSAALTSVSASNATTNTTTTTNATTNANTTTGPFLVGRRPN